VAVSTPTTCSFLTNPQAANGSKLAQLWIEGGPPFVQRQRGFGAKISAGLIKSQCGFGAIKIGNEFNGVESYKVIPVEL
jgi:hypothetical protein